VLFSLGLVFGLAVASVAWAQFGAAGAVRGFKLPEFYDRAPGQTNRLLKTLITGSEARPNGPIYDVKDMRIETFEETGQTNIIARAPQCNVDLGRRIVWSDGRLEVATANGQFWTEGNEGFFCRMSNSVVILSNRVRTVINRQLIQQRTKGATNEAKPN
jgi:hypothetical protein